MWPPVAAGTPRRNRARADMIRYTQLGIVVVSLCWCHVTCEAKSESLAEALKRRSEAFLVYANNYAEEYEPTAFAAVPLSAPIPVVQLLSTVPLAGPPRPPRGAPRPHPPAPDSYPRHQPAESVQRQYAADKYPRPYVPDSYGQYAEETYARPHTSHYIVDFTRLYAPQYARPDHEPHHGDLEVRRPEPAAPEVLYARPDPYGGYTYVKKIANKPPPKKVHKKRAKPVILRIHKYRVVRDDR